MLYQKLYQGLRKIGFKKATLITLVGLNLATLVGSSLSERGFHVNLYGDHLNDVVLHHVVPCTAAGVVLGPFGSYSSVLINSLKEIGIDGLNKYVGFSPWDTGAGFMSIPAAYYIRKLRKRKHKN